MKKHLMLMVSVLALNACSKAPEAAVEGSDENAAAPSVLIGDQKPAPPRSQVNSPIVRPAGKRVVTVYTGLLDASTAERFFDLVANSTDKVIGLKILIEKGDPSNDRYSADFDDGRLVINSGDPSDALMELVVNGSTGTSMGGITVDGFYLIKSGGTHAAGAMSWGAEPVSETSIRLNPAIRVAEKPF